MSISKAVNHTKGDTHVDMEIEEGVKILREMNYIQPTGGYSFKGFESLYINASKTHTKVLFFISL